MTEDIADRRRRLVRDDLGRVAVNLFADRGFDNVTVADIAAAAGISERTFFRYFATKDVILLDYQQYLWTRLVDAVEARPAGEDPVTALREAFVATSHVEPPDRARVLQIGLILAQAPAVHARSQGQRILNGSELIELLAVRFKGRPAIAERNARILVSAMNAVATAEFAAWVRTGGDGDPAMQIGNALRVLETGLTQLISKSGSSNEQSL